MGIELIETETVIGGTTLAAGTLLLQSNGTQTNVGESNITTTPYDIFALDVTETTLVAGTAVADASIFLRGSDIGLDSSSESINAIALAKQAGAAANQAPTADVGGPYVISEGEALNLVGSASSDPDLDTLTYAWDLDNDGNFGEVGEPVTEVPTVSWATLQSFGIDDDTGGPHVIGVQVDDGNGGVDTATTTVTVNNVAPTLSTTGTGAATAGGSYTLNLSASDPGADTITTWTINWGDGAIETIAGNPTSVNHTYNLVGFTYNILASATDEDGTYLQNELLVASSANDRVLRYGRDAGFLQAFATSDGSDYPVDTIIGPDGNLYLSGWNSDDVLRYNATTGAFIDAFVPAGSGGLDSAAGLAFGPDGHLYVASRLTSEVLRFDGSTGAFIDAFITAGSGGLNDAEGLTFGPDGNLYVSDYQDDKVYKYDDTTGAFLTEFVTAGSGGLNFAEDLTFGPDNNLYVADNKSVLRYNGTTGAFIDAFVSAASGGLNFTSGLVFGPDGHLYVGSRGTDNVLRYDGTTGAFIDEYISAGSGGLGETDYLNFVPEHQVSVTAGQPVVAADDSYSTDEDTILNVSVPGVLSNDTGGGGGSLTATNLDTTGTTGLVTLNTDGSFDYDPNGQFESLAAGQSTDDSFVYTADDGSNTDTATVTITVNGANDQPTDIAVDNLSVTENASGAVIGNVSTTDIDSGDTHTYTVDDTRFEVVSGQLKLKSGQSLDFEAVPAINIVITSTDAGTLQTNKNFTITVDDANDLAPVITSAQTFDVAEDVVNLAVVGTVAATDADTTENLARTGRSPAAIQPERSQSTRRPVRSRLLITRRSTSKPLQPATC